MIRSLKFTFTLAKRAGFNIQAIGLCLSLTNYDQTRDNIPRSLHDDDIVDTTKRNYETIAILKAIGSGQ
jgi:hypothetical protein